VPSGKRKPKLGQNFLLDVGAAQRIVAALGDVSDRTVIEIGPGRGILTDLLQPRARRVIGIELDRVLAGCVFSSARSSFHGDSADYGTAAGRTAGGERAVYRVPQAGLRAKA
jgi:hypothetical protein